MTYSKKVDTLCRNIELDMFSHSHNKNDDGKYIVEYDTLHETIDTHIAFHMEETDVEMLVCAYGVFKAIKSYKDEYGDFNIDDDESFMRTFGTLAYHILDNHIRDTDIIIEEEEEIEE